MSEIEGERIAKVMARAGLCSRREAEQWILGGRVSVDGKVLDSPALNVRPGQQIIVDGQPLPVAEPPRLFRYHKPKGVMTTARDPEGRKTLYDTLPEGLPRLMPIGRLDLNSEGLLLLTNDGELKRRLELPSTGWLRRYRVRVFGTPADAALQALSRGVTVNGVAYGPIQAKLERVQGSNAWLVVALREGRNREVRNVMEHLGHEVSRLIRTGYGPFQLGNLEPRAIEEVRPKVLKEQLGLAVAGAPRPAELAKAKQGAAAPAPATKAMAPLGRARTTKSRR
jgi:23S rRNA pseudouridine2605 synthase